MVSLRPLLRFSRVWAGRSSGGWLWAGDTCNKRSAQPKAQTAGQQGTGHFGREPEVLAVFSFLSLAPICSLTPPQGTEKVKENSEEQKFFKTWKAAACREMVLTKAYLEGLFFGGGRTFKKYILIYLFVCIGLSAASRDLVF